MGQKEVVSEKDAKIILGNEEYDDLKHRWDDVCKGDDSVDVNNFCLLIGKQLTPEDANILFSLYDVNKDKKVNWKEFVKAQAKLKEGRILTPPLESEACSRIDSKSLADIKLDWIKVTGTPVTVGSYISFDQFQQLMLQMPEPTLKTLWCMYDLNKDNRLTWVEYICVVVRLMNGTLTEKLSIIFNCMDNDANGFLSRDEFKFACKKFCTQHSDVDEFVTRSFTACDSDHNNKVSLIEFVKWAQSDRAMFTQLVGTFNPL
eukprot:TRINITY_DN16122_c0_g1_i1.p1 TRINITY_DN16122_c0_g1~~TRINITY_DN16122_c0_g1_i1.p1  ORF type:complete len:260 (-),score=40.06 TRINITY_DN16122_c0_g1_i1:124-903(-)